MHGSPGNPAILRPTRHLRPSVVPGMDLGQPPSPRTLPHDPGTHLRQLHAYQAKLEAFSQSETKRLRSELAEERRLLASAAREFEEALRAETSERESHYRRRLHSSRQTSESLRTITSLSSTHQNSQDIADGLHRELQTAKARASATRQRYEQAAGAFKELQAALMLKEHADSEELEALQRERAAVLAGAAATPTSDESWQRKEDARVAAEAQAKFEPELQGVAARTTAQLAEEEHRLRAEAKARCRDVLAVLKQHYDDHVWSHLLSLKTSIQQQNAKISTLQRQKHLLQHELKQLQAPRHLAPKPGAPTGGHPSDAPDVGTNLLHLSSSPAAPRPEPVTSPGRRRRRRRPDRTPRHDGGPTEEELELSRELGLDHRHGTEWDSFEPEPLPPHTVIASHLAQLSPGAPVDATTARAKMVDGIADPNAAALNELKHRVRHKWEQLEGYDPKDVVAFLLKTHGSVPPCVAVIEGYEAMYRKLLSRADIAQMQGDLETMKARLAKLTTERPTLAKQRPLMDREIGVLKEQVSATAQRLELAQAAHARAHGQQVSPHGVRPPLRRFTPVHRSVAGRQPERRPTPTRTTTAGSAGVSASPSPGRGVSGGSAAPPDGWSDFTRLPAGAAMEPYTPMVDYADRGDPLPSSSGTAAADATAPTATAAPITAPCRERGTADDSLGISSFAREVTLAATERQAAPGGTSDVGLSAAQRAVLVAAGFPESAAASTGKPSSSPSRSPSALQSPSVLDLVGIESY